MWPVLWQENQAPFPFQSLWTATPWLLSLPQVQWGPALHICLSPPSIPHFALCQWFLSHERSLLVHMTSGLNRLTAGKFVNVHLGRSTAQKHVWITTAGKAQFNTAWVLSSPSLIPHTQHSAISPFPICHNLYCVFPLCPTYPVLQRVWKSQTQHQVTVQRGRLCNFHPV